MERPLDYPQQSSKEHSSEKAVDGSDISYAELRNRVASEQPITEAMIQTARTRLETAHASADASSKNDRFGFKKIRNRLRPSTK